MVKRPLQKTINYFAHSLAFLLTFHTFQLGYNNQGNNEQSNVNLLFPYNKLLHEISQI